MSEQLPMTSQLYVADRDKASGPWRGLLVGLALTVAGAALAIGAARLAEDLDPKDRRKATRTDPPAI